LYFKNRPNSSNISRENALFNYADGNSDFRDVYDRKRVVLKYWIAFGKKWLLPLLRYYQIFVWRD
jgi:hypothetical protein